MELDAQTNSEADGDAAATTVSQNADASPPGEAEAPANEAASPGAVEAPVAGDETPPASAGDNSAASPPPVEDDESWNANRVKFQRVCEAGIDANIPRGLMLTDGTRIGAWLADQREAAKAGRLDPERARALEVLGVAWSSKDQQWQENFGVLKAMAERGDDVNVATAFVTEDGKKIGSWLRTQRGLRKNEQLQPERVEVLTSIGVKWDLGDKKWLDGFAPLKALFDAGEGVNVMSAYLTADGFKLGQWLNTQRAAKKAGRLSEERAKELEDMGVIWSVRDRQWDQSFEALKTIADAGGAVNVEEGFDVDGLKLGRWLTAQRQARAIGRLPPDREQALTALGVVWTLAWAGDE